MRASGSGGARRAGTDGTADLSNQAALVTGATSGIGFSTARRLATRGATVLVTGRDPRRGTEATNELRRAAGHERVEFLRVDHATVAANLALAEELRSRLGHLDVLVNNVGGLVPSRVTTGDGYELTLALNFVAPFVLTRSLLPLLLTSGSARLINVISSAFTMAKDDPLDDLQSEQTYAPLGVLARAKLLALVWTAALADQHCGGRLRAEAVSREEIRAGSERAQGLWEYFVQATHPGMIRLDGDTASGRAYISELVHLRDGNSHLNYAVYHDRYQRTPDGWKFTERVYEIRYLDTSPLAGSAPNATGAPADPPAGDKASAKGGR
jgi:NAD(P)-dependent dehydrogenase (short-subunit alcohol dehydrogenase family)